MGKGGTVLGLIALILGASGLGLGGFAWLSMGELESQTSNLGDQVSNLGDQISNLTGEVSEQNYWYKYNGTTLNCDPPFTYITFSGLMIEFELEPNESVYFSFTARAHTEAVPGWSAITVIFRVDGYFAPEPSAEGGTYNGAFTEHFMIHLQDVRHDLLPGVHNVTVVIYGQTTANYIYKSSLFVHTFPT